MQSINWKSFTKNVVELRLALGCVSQDSGQTVKCDCARQYIPVNLLTLSTTTQYHSMFFLGRWVVEN